MTGTTQDRLRDAVTALGQAIQPADIPPLRLPEPGRRAGPGRRAARRPAVRTWLIPAGAAAAVLAVIGVIILAARAGSGAEPVTPLPAQPALPRYLVTYGNGTSFVPGGGPGYVRATATGRVVARIPAAARGFTVEGVAAAPGDRVFFLIGAAFASPSAVNVQCFRLVLDANGHPAVPQRLPGSPLLVPVPATSNEATTIPLAISPDGQELAYSPSGLFPPLDGSSSLTVVVQNVATGARRSWSAGQVSGGQISQVSWATRGRLAFVAAMNDAGVVHGAVAAHRHGYLNALMILDTAAAGSGLISSSALVSYGAATATGAPEPGPVAGVISPDGRSAYAQVQTRGGDSQLVTIGTASGKISRVLLSGPQAAQAAPAALDGGALLFTLRALHVRAHHAGAPFVSGHLAGLSLATGQITRLPYPVYTGVEAPAWPMLAAW
jgi:hypothetical protein